MNPLNLFRNSRGTMAVPQAHMTFAHSSAARTIMRTGMILKKQAWLWPIIAVVVLAIVGVGVSSAIRTTMKASFQSQLQTLLNVETSMLETWLKTQDAGAETQANNRSIRDTIEKVIATQAGARVHSHLAAWPNRQIGRDVCVRQAWLAGLEQPLRRRLDVAGTAAG